MSYCYQFVRDRFKRLRTPANVFIINLTACDFFSCLIHPMAIYSSFRGRWSFGRTGKFNYFCQKLSCSTCGISRKKRTKVILYRISSIKSLWNAGSGQVTFLNSFAKFVIPKPKLQLAKKGTDLR